MTTQEHEKPKNSYRPGAPSWVRDTSTEEYFLTEWGAVPRTQEALFEHLCLMTFQLGLWWRTVLGKRTALADFFGGYCPTRVAALTDEQLLQATEDTALIRNIFKLRACRDNARQLLTHEVCLPELFTEHFPHTVWVDTFENLPRTHEATDAICGYLRDAGLRYIGPVSLCSVAQAAGYIRVEQSKGGA